MQKKMPKITLRRETLHQLTTGELQAAVGANTLVKCPKTNTCNVHNYTCSGPRCY